MKRQTGGLNEAEIVQLFNLYRKRHSQYSTYKKKALLFISLGFLINEDTDISELKSLSNNLESNIIDQVNIILDTTDEETMLETLELRNHIYQELAKIDEEIKSMVESIDVDLQQHQLWKQYQQ